MGEVVHVPVRALVWLKIDEDGDVAEAELSADTSWMELDPKMRAFTHNGGSLRRPRAQKILDSLIESDRWAETELKLDV